MRALKGIILIAVGSIASLGCEGSDDRAAPTAGSTSLQTRTLTLCSSLTNPGSLDAAEAARLRILLQPSSHKSAEREALLNPSFGRAQLQRGPLSKDHRDLDAANVQSELMEWQSRVFENGRQTSALIEHRLPSGDLILENLHVFREVDDLRPPRSTPQDVTYGFRAAGSDETVVLQSCDEGEVARDLLETTGLGETDPVILRRTTAVDEDGQRLFVRAVEVIRPSAPFEHRVAQGRWAVLFGDTSRWTTRIDFSRSLETYQLYFRDFSDGGGPSAEVLEKVEYLGNPEWVVTTMNPQTGARSRRNYEGRPRWRQIEPQRLLDNLEGNCDAPRFSAVGEPSQFVVYLAYCTSDGPGLQGLRFVTVAMLPSQMRYIGRQYSRSSMQEVTVLSADGPKMALQRQIGDLRLQVLDEGEGPTVRLIDFRDQQVAQSSRVAQPFTSPPQEQLTAQGQSRDGAVQLSALMERLPDGSLMPTSVQVKWGDRLYWIEAWDALGLQGGALWAQSGDLRFEAELQEQRFMGLRVVRSNDGEELESFAFPDN